MHGGTEGRCDDLFGRHGAVVVVVVMVLIMMAMMRFRPMKIFFGFFDGRNCVTDTLLLYVSMVLQCVTHHVTHLIIFHSVDRLD